MKEGTWLPITKKHQLSVRSASKVEQEWVRTVISNKFTHDETWSVDKVEAYNSSIFETKEHINPYQFLWLTPCHETDHRKVDMMKAWSIMIVLVTSERKWQGV